MKEMKETKYIIEEQLYLEIGSILDNYYGLLEHLDEYRNDNLTDDFNTLERILDEYGSLPIYESESTASEEEKSKEKREPTVGECVRVINSGECYTTYADWIETHISEPCEKYLWNYGTACYNGDIGRILCIAPHEHGNTNLAYVKMGDGKCYLIGTEGLEIL